jgi:hypothetical protein
MGFRVYKLLSPQKLLLWVQFILLSIELARVLGFIEAFEEYGCVFFVYLPTLGHLF